MPINPEQEKKSHGLAQENQEERHLIINKYEKLF